MSKQPNYVFDDELYHHGIQGQRWGFRRFQNEDGSWTPEGRERYGEGGARSKSDVQKYKAKVSYNTQKYKADLKLKSQKEKIAREAKEEKARIKEQGKIDRAARKEQNKLDRKQAKLDKKLAKEQAKAKDTTSLKNKLVRTKRYTMSDDELSKVIDRLKLEAEYNKQYALAAKPNGALARADRFFEGPTGQAVTKIAVAAAPKLAETAAKEILGNAMKYANPEDRKAKQLELENSKLLLESNKKLYNESISKAKLENEKAAIDNRNSIIKSKYENERARIDNRNAVEANLRARGKHVQETRHKEEQNTKNKNVQSNAYNVISQDYANGKIDSKEYLERLKKYGLL